MIGEVVMDPLERLEAAIASSKRLPKQGERWQWTVRAREDPLESILERVRGASLIATQPPPLLGLQLAIEVARETLRGLAAGDLDVVAEEDPLRLESSAKESASPAPEPSHSVTLSPTPRAAPGRAPEAPKGVISEILLEALATQPLSGQARALAAHTLAEGIALDDPGAMKRALAILMTGQ